MATTHGNQDPTLMALLAQPRQYHVMQAMRLLQRVCARDSTQTLCLRSELGCAFPVADINTMQYQLSESGQSIITMTTTFFGLVGPSGILPDHDKLLVLIGLTDDGAVLGDFLDIFHHHLMCLLYRAWCWGHVVLEHEQSRSRSKWLKLLLAHSGSAAVATNWVFYAGLWGSRRSSHALILMLSDYFSVPVTVEQFVGRWRQLSQQQWTCLSSDCRYAAYHQLGVDTVMGDCVWHAQNNIVVHMGPLSYGQFCHFLPGSARRRQLQQMVRAYLGLEFEVTFLLHCRAASVPPLQLCAASLHQLAWNTCLGQPSDFNVTIECSEHVSEVPLNS